jgi:hypothetical protein
MTKRVAVIAGVGPGLGSALARKRQRISTPILVIIENVRQW